jgi:membrane protease YdiL (CAAX protease family)
MKKIIIYAISCILILYVVEQVLELPYIIKTMVKLPLFTVYPIYKLKGMPFILHRQDFLRVSVISIFVFCIVSAAYLIFSPLIDTSIIQSDFLNRMQITNTQFALAALYTVFVNSFIEELFFRGYVFKGLLKNRKVAYIFSSALFALYHVTIFKTWFSLPVFLLTMVGLFIGGLIFSYFVEKSNSFLASYLIHISADLAIVGIGIHVLGIA